MLWFLNFPLADPKLLGKGRAGNVIAPWSESVLGVPDPRPAGYAGFVVDAMSLG